MTGMDDAHALADKMTQTFAEATKHAVERMHAAGVPTVGVERETGRIVWTWPDGTKTYEAPMRELLPPAITDETRPVYDAACALLPTMGNQAVAQLLREIAAEIARGDVAHDPWGPGDSRSPELRAEILKRRRRKR